MSEPKVAAAAVAVVTIGATIGQVTVLDWVAVLVVCFAGGLAGILRELRTGEPPKNWLVFLSARMFFALCAGMIAFALGELGDVPDFFEIPSIFFAAYGGAWALEKMGGTIFRLPGGSDKSIGGSP